MQTPYDPQNVFARILRGEIPCQKLHDDEFALAFPDIRPQAPIHILIIPKGPYVDAAHFAQTASNDEIAGFWRAVGLMVAQCGAGTNGFRLIANSGEYGGQEVPHFHIHLLGGAPLGPMLSR